MKSISLTLVDSIGKTNFWFGWFFHTHTHTSHALRRGRTELSLLCCCSLSRSLSLLEFFFCFLCVCGFISYNWLGFSCPPRAIPSTLQKKIKTGNRDGTTDVTRTVHLTTPTAKEIDAFTRVLRGHIALARAVFPNDTPGFFFFHNELRWVHTPLCPHPHTLTSSLPSLPIKK